MAGSKIQTVKDRIILPQALLALLTEDLKAPMALVARLSELAELSKSDTNESLQNIRSVSQSALRLIDAYALALKLTNLDGAILLEPVSVSAIMAEVQHELESLAADYEVEIELVLPKQSSPVVTNHRALLTALTSAGASLIEALATNREETAGQARLQLCAQNNKGGIRAGWYWSGAKIDAEILRRGGLLAATSRQPQAPISAGPSSGIFIADSILVAMGSRLRACKYHNLYGLATYLTASQQLLLV